MNPFILPIAQLIQSWKDVRNSLNKLDEKEQVQAVVDFWKMCPVSKYSYDPEALDEYPTPWEMMHQNDWCENSLSVAMEFTLRLGGISPDKLVIKMIKDYDLSIQKLVLEYDGKYWLNYEYGMVIPIPDTNHDVMEKWKFGSKRYERF